MELVYSVIKLLFRYLFSKLIENWTLIHSKAICSSLLQRTDYHWIGEFPKSIIISLESFGLIRLRKDGAVILCGNHGNQFIDALVNNKICFTFFLSYLLYFIALDGFCSAKSKFRYGSIRNKLTIEMRKNSLTLHVLDL